MKKTNQLLKRLMAAVLAVIMLSGVFVTTMPEEAEAATVYNYSATDAINYAKKNWDNGVGQCAHFVSKCVIAGGLNMSTKSGTGGCISAIRSATGVAPQNITLSSGYAKKSNNSSKMAAGDVVAIWCTTCKQYTHVMLCGGYNSSGYAIYYAHNNAIGGASRKLTAFTCNNNASHDTVPKVLHITGAACKHTDGYKTKWNGEKYVATVCKKCGAAFSHTIETSTSGTFYAHAKTSARSQPYEDAPAVIDYNAKDAVTVLGKTVNAYGNIWYQVSKTVSGKTVKGYILSDRLFSSNPNITADYVISYYNNYSGKNYIPDSDFEVLDSSNVFSRDTAISTVSVDSSNKHNGYNTLKVVNAEAGKNGHDIVMKTTTQGTSTLNWLGNSKSMTLSFWAKCSKDGATFSVRWGYEPVAKCRKVTLTTSWKKYTIRMDKTKICDNYLHLFVNAKGTYWMSEVQLEDGTSATEFAPERGGSYTTKTSTYPGKFSLPSAPTRSGYSFDGWYTKNIGGTKVTSSTASKCGKYALYAHWTKKSGTSDPDVYYTYSVSYVGEDGTSLGTDYIKNLQGTTHTVTPPVFSGYETPAAQTVTWDVSVKTIIFTYRKIKTYTYPKTTVSGTIWKYNGTNVLTYKAVIETRNRTADSIEYRVTWTNSIVKDRYYGYTQKYQVKCGSATTGTLTICGSSTMAKSTVGKVRTASKASSWIKVTGLSASATSLTMKGYFYSGCSEDNKSFSKTITIPAY